jgi:hypothetical protein
MSIILSNLFIAIAKNSFFITILGRLGALKKSLKEQQIDTAIKNYPEIGEIPKKFL